MLQVNNVVKRYGRLTAVDHVSFEARQGRILGILGPNGAGKTSTIRMITYITIPDEGEVLLDGRPVGAWSQEQMGYLPEEKGLYKKLRVTDQLVYLARLKGLDASTARQRVDYWLERFGAESWASKKTEELSKGMQQKVQFIATILHDPALLILDEPFGGLDPINSELLREIILELRNEGRIILFASHRMEQVEQLCDDICLVSRGRVLLEGPLREVKRRFGRDTVTITFEGDDAFLYRLAAEGRVRIGSHSRNRAEVRLLDGTPPRQVLEAAMASVQEIYRFEVSEPPLTEIFVSVVESEDGTPETRGIASTT
ncbi:MAG: ABC transporter ATP-binding protein [Bacteroidota bacterium]